MKVTIKMYNLQKIHPSIPEKLTIQELSPELMSIVAKNPTCPIITKLYGKIEAYNLVTIVCRMAIVLYPAANIYH